VPKIKNTEDSMRKVFMSLVGTVFIVQMLKEWYTAWFSYILIFILIHYIFVTGEKND